MEVWFRNLSTSDQNLLRPRLCSNDEINHTSAFYELFFHQYFLQRGIPTVHEPSLGIASIPDFLVEYPGCPFLLEITTAWTSDDSANAVNNQIMFLQYLDNVSEQFLLSVTFDRSPLPHGVQKFRQAVGEWLSTLEPEATAQKHFSSVDYGFRGSISAIPRGAIVSQGTIYEWAAPRQHVSDSNLACYRARHKDMPFKSSWSGPLVLAVCGRDNTALDEVEACEELFGEVEIKANPRRVREVVLTDVQSGARLLRTKWISAVLFCNRRFGRTGMVYELKVFHNPAAKHVLPSSVFSELPQLLPVESSPSIKMRWSRDFPASQVRL
jgi:hypothetical protein